MKDKVRMGVESFGKEGDRRISTGSIPITEKTIGLNDSEIFKIYPTRMFCLP